VKTNKKTPSNSDLPPPSLAPAGTGQYVRWAFFLVLAYAAITYATVHVQRHPLKVFEAPRSGLKTLDDLQLVEIYSGQQSYVGWPLRWLVYREQADEPSPYAPLQMTQVKFSLIALALDLLGMMALIILAVQVSRTLRGSRFTWRRGVLMLICLVMLLSLIPLKEYDFVGEIPTQPGQERSKK
jgi:hypothetical protein